MLHLIFFYYILSFTVGFSGIIVLIMAYLKTKDRLFINYLLFMTLFAVSLLFLTVNDYVNKNRMAGTDSLFNGIMGFVFTGRFLVISGVLYSVFVLSHRLTEIPARWFHKVIYALFSLIPVFSLGSELFFYHSFPDFRQRLIQIYYINMKLIPGVMLFLLIFIAFRLKKIQNILYRELDKWIVLSLIFFFPLLYLQYNGIIYRTLKIEFYFEYAFFTFWNLANILLLWKFIFKKMVMSPYKPGNVFLSKYGITDMESRIISMVMQSYGNKQIAYDFGIAEQTVKSHLYNAYKKCGVKTRVELINLIFRENIADTGN